MSYYDYWGFPRSSPIDVKGGIKARSRRGGFGQSWWAKRWQEILEGFDIGERLARGRTYARRGQVISIDIGNGSVKARVQGSDTTPYAVSIKVTKVSRQDWERVSGGIFSRPVLAAKLLAGQMPEGIEKVFSDAGLSLFPSRKADLRTDCDCPDWSNPCKHIAAVYLLLGEEFDRDPFLIFKMRGAGREKLLKMVGLEAPTPRDEPASVATDTPGDPEPLPEDPGQFWGASEQPTPETVDIPQIHAALPKRLGAFPFWRGQEAFIDTMESIYGDASPVGLDALLAGDMDGG